MKDIGKVFGNSEQAKPLIVGKDTVYIHTDIIKVEEDKNGKPIEDLYQYNEVQYEKDEYIEIMAEQNIKLNNDLTDTQLALVEIYENLGV